MGFDAALCTELKVSDGRYTGYLASPNCWGPEKIRRLTEWWHAEEPTMLYAYGDSRGDTEMLARADVRYYRGVEIIDKASDRAYKKEPTDSTHPAKPH
jgi:phosphatidylglycerophosphatase C